MIPKRLNYLFILTFTAFITYSFTKSFSDDDNYDWFKKQPSKLSIQLAPTEDELEYIHFEFPFVGRSITAFRQALAFRESRGSYKVVNPYGYMGKYQFGKSTLLTVGISDTSEFLRRPRMQEKAFVALLSRNKWYLRNEINTYVGTTINGIEVTESGILAAAHLGGVGGTKRYLKSKGSRRFKDGFGTSMKSYFKKFGRYDTSGIEADANAVVEM